MRTYIIRCVFFLITQDELRLGQKYHELDLSSLESRNLKQPTFML